MQKYLLFHLEDMSIEMLLQLFICKINTKLFKQIVWKDFEPENIQKSNRFRWLTSRQSLVEAFNKPIE
jgi:hypothetical protein